MSRFFQNIFGNPAASSDDGIYGDTLSGNKIIDLLRRLESERIVLKLNLIGRDYERLSIVTRVDEEDGTSFFHIDYPKGFIEVLSDERAGAQRIAFEFIGADRVPYAFRAVLDKVEGRDIRVRVPDVVERIQRRKHFRIAPPVGTLIVFLRDRKECRYSVIDLSLGGAMISPLKDPFPAPRLYPDEEIRHLTLIVQKKIFRIRIQIRKAQVLRSGKDTGGRPFYGIHFMEIGKEEGNMLEKWLFKWQRAVLLKRSQLSGK